MCYDNRTSEQLQRMKAANINTLKPTSAEIVAVVYSARYSSCVIKGRYLLKRKRIEAPVALPFQNSSTSLSKVIMNS